MAKEEGNRLLPCSPVYAVTKPSAQYCCSAEWSKTVLIFAVKAVLLRSGKLKNPEPQMVLACALVFVMATLVVFALAPKLDATIGAASIVALVF